MTDLNAQLKNVLTLEQDLQKFEVRSSAVTLSKIYSPHFYEISASGKTLMREDILNRLPTIDDKTKIECLNFKIHSLSENIVLISYTAKKINPDGTSIQYLKNSVWKNNNGLWQLEFHQGTIKN